MNDNIDVLTLGAGGIKGFIELGAVYVLESEGKLNNIKSYTGTSVGAMICLLHNIGLSVKEIIYLAVENVNIVDLESDNIDFIILVNNLRKHYGLFSTQKIRDALYGAIINKIGYIPTFKQLYERTGKELVIVSFNLSRMDRRYLSYKNSPNDKCLDAVMLSINIPGIFFMAEYNGDIYLDGAFADPYPILVKDDGKNNILGIYVETDVGDKSYANPLIYIHDVFHCTFHAMTRRNIEEASTKCRHLALKSNLMDTIGTSVTTSDKARMILDGIKTAQESFS